MNIAEKSDYVKAVKCLQSQPAVNPAYPQAITRFDEFQAHYMKQADNVHNLVRFSVLKAVIKSLQGIYHISPTTRVNSCLGTDIISGRTRRPCATSVDIGAPLRKFNYPAYSVYAQNAHPYVGIGIGARTRIRILRKQMCPFVLCNKS